MFDDNLSELPPWDDHTFDSDDVTEQLKNNVTKEACKLMYAQWSTVMLVLKAALDCLKLSAAEGISKKMFEEHAEMLLADAYEVAVKIRSSEAACI